MTADVVTIYRKSANGRIEAIDVKPDEAEFSIARWPWPPERGEPCNPPNWSPAKC